mgnify:CR=1 FL=1
MKELERMKDAREDGLLQSEGSGPSADVMREFIVDTARGLRDVKLLKILYMRAKTLREMEM